MPVLGRRPRNALNLLGCLVTAAALCLGTASPAGAAGPAVQFTQRGIGFGQTVYVTNAGDGTGRLFTVDRLGRVLSWVPGAPRATVYLDLHLKVNFNGGEEGLLGLTFWPDFRGTPLVFVAYTASDRSLQVSRFRLPSYTAATVNPATEEHVINVPHRTYANHNGGMLVFGKDKQLYVSTGDGGGGGDPFANAQSLASLSGKILRLDAAHYCAGHPYCSPPTNPFVHTAGALGQIWQYGLRNPWRFSVDPVTGTMWIGDVGQDAFEEVDTAAMSAGGSNFGWSCREGFSTYNASRCSATANYVNPLLVVAHPNAQALIGGVVYRGPAYAATLAGRYVFGDYITGTVWTVAPGSNVASPAGSLNGITSLGTDQAGEVWATTLAGGIYRMST
ncbi:MAG: PQQ-dependent sugar dehydrogenase [Actinomycetota bacterium]|nr:PQQ-dependent sugar dehydrogenase [Actinomycetota bacterium]